MRFEDILVRIDEIMHRSIEAFKAEALGRSSHSDVTISQLAYIEAVSRLERPTLTALADELGVTKASASTCVHKLIRKGLMMAELSDDDGRVIYISLTEGGRSIIDAEAAAYRGLVARVRRALTKEEAENLRLLLEKIVSSMGA
jgi:DNA-binding MarR family transcriptional regulator